MFWGGSMNERPNCRESFKPLRPLDSGGQPLAVRSCHPAELVRRAIARSVGGIVARIRPGELSDATGYEPDQWPIPNHCLAPSDNEENLQQLRRIISNSSS